MCKTHERNDRVAQAKDQIKKVYNQATVTKSGDYLTTVNQLTDQLPALQPQTLIAAKRLIEKEISDDVGKVAVEEDKGMPIGVVVASECDLPLAVARWYTYEIDRHQDMQATVDIDSEYYSGRLYLNGVESDDRVTIVDDTISTGGTMIAMINAIREMGATVKGAHCVVEKYQNGGVKRVHEKTGVDVTTAVTIEVDEDGVSVVD